MKRLRILVEGSKRPPFKIQIRLTTTARDILAHLNLDEDYALYPVSDPKRLFSSEEELYDYVKNDEKLIARISPETALRELPKFLGEVQPANTHDIEEARRELRKLVEVDDDPPTEPLDTSDADAYIRSFFKKKE